MTQIMRDPMDDDNCDDDENLQNSGHNNNGLIIECNDKNNPESKVDKGDPKIDDHGAPCRDDFHALIDDTTSIKDPMQSIGTMNDFNKSLANFEDIKRIGKWAKTTANTLQIENEEGFDALLELFDATLEQNGSMDSDDSVGQCSLIEEQPSQRGEQVAREIELSVKEGPQQRAIERMCPNWKENIEFAQAQTNPVYLENALHNVREAKNDLEIMKGRILQAFFDRQQTLELYERSLQGSIDRLPKKANDDQCTD